MKLIKVTKVGGAPAWIVEENITALTISNNDYCVYIIGDTVPFKITRYSFERLMNHISSTIVEC